MSGNFNYRHLYYFWVVAKEGGMSRGAARLGMAVQTVSTQVRELERALGHVLLKPAGRGLVLTEAGQATLRQADLIFQLGERLPEVVKEALQAPSVRLAVGIADSLPKLVAHSLLQPVLQADKLRLVCHVDEFDDLLADLALHRLDVVLADRGVPPQPSLRLHSHLLASSPMAWYAPPRWAEAASRGFPGSLATVPVLLPTPHASVRVQLDLWFERQGVRPHTVGEFEDSTLLKTFGAGGLGVFPAVQRIEDDLLSHYGVQRVGSCEGVAEHYYAIGARRQLLHPLVQLLLPGLH